MAIKTKGKSAGLEDNLHRNGKYFLYIHPKTKARHSLNLLLKDANAAAAELNGKLAPSRGSKKDDIVAKILGESRGD